MGLLVFVLLVLALIWVLHWNYQNKQEQINRPKINVKITSSLDNKPKKNKILVLDEFDGKHFFYRRS